MSFNLVCVNCELSSSFPLHLPCHPWPRELSGHPSWPGWLPPRLRSPCRSARPATARCRASSRAGSDRSWPPCPRRSARSCWSRRSVGPRPRGGCRCCVGPLCKKRSVSTSTSSGMILGATEGRKPKQKQKQNMLPSSFLGPSGSSMEHSWVSCRVQEIRKERAAHENSTLWKTYG